MNKNTKKLLIISIIIVAIILIAWFVLFNKSSTASDTPLSQTDIFAQCIADSGAKFYGATWCPACNSQKDDFGQSAQLLPYVECSLPASRTQNLLCKKEGIEAYPTWKFSDGTSIANKLSFQQLSENTGCALPADEQ
jgi:thiol-disulfide isomerase/thioredoxin